MRTPSRRSWRFGNEFLLPLLSILALLCPGLAGVASAGVNTWTTNGPEGGETRALAIDPANPATLYAGTTGGGVFKSTNGGGNWTAINTGMTISYVNGLAIDPSAPVTLYAGTSGGVFKTSNGGESWTAVGLANTFIHALAIDPLRTATVYAGTDRSGVLKSDNGGESWAAVNGGLTSLSVYSLAIDPASPATVYAGTFQGIFKSTDRGANWMFAFGYNNAAIDAMVIDSSAPSRIYAGSAPFEWPPGGVVKSTDGGLTWTDGGLSGREVLALAIDPSSPITLYAGTEVGLFKTINGGNSWESIGSSLSGTLVFALAARGSTSGTVYAGTLAGVFRSNNAAVSWQAVNAGLIATSVNALAIDPSATSTLYAGTYGGGVFKSTDAGQSWTTVNLGLTSSVVAALTIDPSAPTTLYAGTDMGVFKSMNGGESWSAINAGLPLAGGWLFVNALAVDPSTPATLYAGTGDGVFKSTDGGKSWIDVSAGLTADYQSVYALAIDASAPATLYALTNGGIFKTTNGGTSWTENFVGRFFSALVIDPSAPAILYASSGGVFKSTNGGGNWTEIGTGPTNAGIVSLAVDPSSSETLYAGTSQGGVFRSTDAGRTWTAFNAGLRSPRINALAIDPATPATIYAGTGGGVYEYQSVGGSCVADVTTLCLNGGRFRVTAKWSLRDGQSGLGQAVGLTGESGYFTFFDPDNVEIVVKIVDGCALNSRFWTFAGGLTDAEVVLTVQDIQTGAFKVYENSQGTPFEPIQDTDAFAGCSGAPATVYAGSGDGSSNFGRGDRGVFRSTDGRLYEYRTAAGPCVPDATALCLNDGRFRVTVQWSLRDGRSGVGQAVALSGLAGYFTFFDPGNVEIVTKILNGCGVNSRWWTFAAGLTNVNVILSVTDTQTGAVKTYVNPQGIPFEPIQDTNAFASCP